MATLDYKMCWVLDYKVWQNGLQGALGITKCSRVVYKVRQGLQNVAELQSELAQMLPILSGKKPQFSLNNEYY